LTADREHRIFVAGALRGFASRLRDIIDKPFTFATAHRREQLLSLEQDMRDLADKEIDATQTEKT
jgi:hypothetical protein